MMNAYAFKPLAKSEQTKKIIPLRYDRFPGFGIKFSAFKFEND